MLVRRKLSQPGDGLGRRRLIRSLVDTNGTSSQEGSALGRGVLTAPFPFPGGKRRIAEVVWDRIGTNLSTFIEPFGGSAAITLARPMPVVGREVINDCDCLLINAWRGIKYDPDQTAEYAHCIRSESELHARNIVLKNLRGSLQPRIENDPEYYDAKLAGWWLFGICMALGHNFIVQDGPWHSVDGKLVCLEERSPNGIIRSTPNARVRGVLRCTLPELKAWFQFLAVRLERAIILCGDWSRAVTLEMMGGVRAGGTVAIVFDPPYGTEADYDINIYSVQDPETTVKVRQWCVENGSRPNLRIVYCGYYSGKHGEAGGEGDVLERAGWMVHRYSTPGGFGSLWKANQDKDLGGGRKKLGNRHRETIYFSPQCKKDRRLMPDEVIS